MTAKDARWAPLFCFCWILVAAPAFSAPRNVLLITIDTVRADYLGCYGSKKAQTPNLDHLSESGVTFLRNLSPVPLTLPSHTSIMTALYPPSHGVRDNATYRLSEKTVTLATVLKKHGYTTAAFVGSFVLDHRFGLNQGFDYYDDDIPTESSRLESLEVERNGDAVFKSFEKWLETYHGEKPFFVWIHLYDPHTPYRPPEPYHTKYADNLYAGEIAYTDSIVGKIVQNLESRKLLGNSLIAVVGDHGEGLGDHQEKTHSVLIYNSTLHVPMILSAPGVIPQGAKVSSLSRTIDLAPTLLDYLSFSDKLGEGISLRKSMEQKGGTTEITAYSESLYPKLNLGWSELYGLETGKYHLIQSPEPELYDTEQDPGEIQNLIQRQPDIARKLQQELSAQQKLDTGASQQTSIDSETRDKLSSLGYVSGSPAPKATGINPKDKMGVWNEIQTGLQQFMDRDYSSALITFKKIHSSEKGILLIYEYLGGCYVHLERWTDAKETYTEALNQGLNSSSIHMNLGIIHYQLKEFGAAQKELEKAVQLGPLNVTAEYYLGNVLRSRGQLNEAVGHYERSLQINPHYLFAVNGLAMTYAALKKDDDALKYFQLGVDLDPDNIPGYFNLAVQLERMGRSQEALQEYRIFVQRAPAKEYSQQRSIALAAVKRLESQ